MALRSSQNAPLRSSADASKAKSSSGISPQALQSQVLSRITKLNDRDTTENGAEMLRALAAELRGEELGLMLRTCCSQLNTDAGTSQPRDKQLRPFARARLVQLLGDAGAASSVRLTRKTLVWLCRSMVRTSSDGDSSVRDAAACALSVLAEGTVAGGGPLPADAAATPDAAGGSGGGGGSGGAGGEAAVLSIFLKPIFEHLALLEKRAQVGAALCLAKLIFKVGGEALIPTLPRLCARLAQRLEAPGCAAHSELLQVRIFVIWGVVLCGFCCLSPACC